MKLSADRGVRPFATIVPAGRPVAAAAVQFAVHWVLPLAVTGVALAVALSRIDFAKLVETGQDLGLGALITAGVTLCLGALLSCLRLRVVARQLGHALTAGDAIVATTSGQLAGTLFFQVFGQTIARTAMLGKAGVPPSTTLLLTGYERLVAAVISISLAFAGAWYLFGYVAFDMRGGGWELVKILVGIAAVAASGAVFVWGRPLAAWLHANLQLGTLFLLLRVVAISAAIQAATMLSYILLARELAPSVDLLDLAAAFSIVMLAASIPVSFAGWGLREVSAIYALRAIHVSSETALVVALLIGVLSIGVTAFLALVGTTSRPSAEAAHRPVAMSQPRLDTVSFVYWLIPLFTASAVFFQIHVPVGGGTLDVNFGDTLVLFGGALFALRYFATSGRWARCRVRNLGAFVLATSGIIALSLFHGWLLNGWTDWAFVNRGFGWVVLLSYAATGALIVIEADGEGFRMFLKTFVIAGLATTSVDLLLTALTYNGVTLPHELVAIRIAAFTQNPNALAFALLMVMSGVIAIGERRRLPWLLGLTLTGMFFAGSRAGAGATLAVLSGALILRFLGGREVLSATAVAAALVLLISGYPFAWLFAWLSGLGAGAGGLHIFALNVQAGAVVSNAQRWTSMVLGWRMFLAHPLFGAGLGAFYASYLRAHGHGLVIHSAPLWLLAETGVIGFLAFVWPFISIVRTELARRRSSDPSRIVVLLSLTAFAVMASVHELLFQRVLWLVLGAALVATREALPDRAPVAAAAEVAAKSGTACGGAWR